MLIYSSFHTLARETIQAGGTQRAGLKYNERRRVRKPTSTENSVTDRPVAESCIHDDLRVINLSDHNRVRVYYGCKLKSCKTTRIRQP